MVSDWTAIRTTESAAAGTDLCMPGPPYLWGAPLAAAVRAGKIAESAIDDKVRRILRFAQRVGALDGTPQSPPVFSDQQARDLVRRVAAQAMVLVRNDGVLPLTPDTTVALLGPSAGLPRLLGGGSATVIPSHTSTPVDGLTGRLPLTHTAGVHLCEDLIPIPLPLMTDPESGAPGLSTRYLTGDTVLGTEHRTTSRLVLLGDPLAAQSTIIELRTRLRADMAGDWQIGFGGVGHLRLDIDGQTVLDENVALDSGDPAAALLNPPQRHVTRTLADGEEVDVLLVTSIEDAMPGLGIILGATLGIRRPQRDDDAEFAAAIELARAADVAVVVVGTTEQIESEGVDRVSLRLPGRQDELVAAVAAVNPRTVVVVNSGAPVELPWRDDVAAVLLSWFPGQEFGTALADVLTGAAEPGGRLPTTWPKTMADVPVLNTSPVDGVLDYSEGIHIGYRAWLRAGTEPAYPFGHGLGYTTWSTENLVVEGRTLSITVSNTGERVGKQVVQVYLSRPDSAVDRPVRWLAGFTAVTLAPGDSRTVPITLPERAFQHWTAAGWATEPGAFTVQVGTSVTDLPHTAYIY
ncbi:glycoside hydrolase family 3 C-terminal domain-containing protein [Nocardia suismassiliense]|uniref:glycoside hydrolase family 3 C-terminal domain-containing protein n=1 Tax=Nocardia suismassiliense TaxID=2077092 RepID=UPI0018FE3389|nr:glycoside hydrolase family 3 C-terminal domain-containing protein [Nocardia suismassiliense]